VIGARDEAFAHLVGHEQGNATGAAVLVGGLHQGAQVLFRCHVAYGVVNEDGVKRSAQAKRPDVALEVLAVGVEGSTNGQHLGRHIDEGHLEMTLEVGGIVTPA